MAKDPTKPDKSRQKPGSRALRDQAIIAQAMAGKTTGEIAAAVGLSRQTVSQVLNSEEVKAKVAEIDGRLAAGIDDAVETILRAAKTDPRVAIELLRNFGAMLPNVKVEHTWTLEEIVAGSNAPEKNIGSGNA